MININELDKMVDIQESKKILLDFETSIRTEGLESGSGISTYAPINLYKYFTPEPYNINHLINNTVSMSPPSGYNDPYDCAFDISYINGNNSLVSQLEKMKSRIYISCYSERCDSILMWSHYARNHKGFCLEYLYPEVGLSGYDKVGYTNIVNMLAPVIYGEKINIQLSTNSRIIDKQILTLICNKAFDWIYEQEWRRIVIFPKGLDNLPKDRFDMSSAKVKSVIMGCAIEKEIEDKLITICKNKIPLYKMVMDRDSFVLHKREINVV